MSARSYLSIGDVLSLLREEFPDVTISKIRFLESQGLVDPERSPSGYRKFYDHDVERLRWVLRQQREHFLPLKVIRDRLAAAGNGVPSDEPYEGLEEVEGPGAGAVEADTWEPEVHSAGVSTVSEPVAAGVRAGSASGASSSVSHGPNGDGGRWSRTSHETPERGSVGLVTERKAPEPATEPAPEPGAVMAPVDTATVQATEGQATAGQATAGQATAGQATAGQATAVREHGESAQDPGVTSRPGGATAPRVHRERDGTVGVGGGAPRIAAAASAGASSLAPPVSGVSMTLEELCAATGLSGADVQSLEGFGLVSPLAVAGSVYYDEEALTVAKLVVEFSRFGVEPRHLRLFRNAVDREMGLVEQVITPLIRQRNPEARQRAVEAVSELVRLGQGLRASLVRTELRRQLGS